MATGWNTEEWIKPSPQRTVTKQLDHPVSPTFVFHSWKGETAVVGICRLTALQRLNPPREQDRNGGVGCAGFLGLPGRAGWMVRSLANQACPARGGRVLLQDASPRKKKHIESNTRIVFVERDEGDGTIRIDFLRAVCTAVLTIERQHSLPPSFLSL